MVPEFDAYCFDPTTEKGVIGVIGSSFGTHLVRLDKQSLEGGGAGGQGAEDGGHAPP